MIITPKSEFKPMPEYRKQQISYNMSAKSFAIPARNRSIKTVVFVSAIVIALSQACYMVLDKLL